MLQGRTGIGVVVICMVFFTAAWTKKEDPSTLDRLVDKVSERQSYTEKKKKNFEERLKSYYFEKIKPEDIERLMKENTPGVTLAAVSFAVVAKTSPLKIAGMKKEGKSWPQIAKVLNADINEVIREVKEYRKSIG